MKNINNKIVVMLAALLYLVSCKPKFYDTPEAPAPKAGTLTITGYVAIGGAITAGFADNALYNGIADGGGQQGAYPNLIAKQLKSVSAGLVFNQPEIQSSVGWASFTTVDGVGGNWGKRQLAYPFAGANGVCNTATVQPQNIEPSNLTALETFNGDKSKLTNLAVPFITLKQVSAQLSTFAVSSSSANPYGYLINIMDDPSESIASIAAAKQAAVFTLWLGYDEAIAIARTGLVTAATTIDTTGLRALVSGLLLAQGSKGLIANLPYIDQFPIVTYNNRRLTSATDPASFPGARTVNGKVVKRSPNVSLDGFNLALGTAVFTVDSTKTQNYVIAKGDGSLAIINTGKDFVVNAGIIDLQLGVGPQDSLAARSCTPNYTKRKGLGLVSPIPNNAVLDAGEIADLRTQIDQYNVVLKDIVAQHPDRLVLVDMNSFFLRLSDPLAGIAFGTEILRANHPTLGPDFGGFFSTDRTYPTPKGQALIANEFIKALNAKWGATVPLVAVNSYRANKIPN